MCGLYGYNTKKGVRLGKKQREQRGRLLSSLALAMQDRGTHSTGVAGVCNEHGWCMVKDAVSATKFNESKEYKEFLEHSPRVVIGHTRYATIGAISQENAHPLQEGNIIGAHNGSVYNYKEVYPTCKVDSQAIFDSLDRHNNDFAPALKEVRGQFAVTWFDQNNLDKLHIVLDGNPLSIVRIPELQTYFWCSTYYSLLSILASHFDMTKNVIWTPKDESVYTIDGKHQIKRTEIEFGKIPPVVRPTFSGRYGEDDDWRDKIAEKSNWQKYLDSGEDQEESEIVEGKDLISSGNTARNYKKVMDLSVEDMRHIMDFCEECEFCQKQLDTENETIYWHEEVKIVMCYVCAAELELWSQYLILSNTDLMDIDSELWIIDNEPVGEECESRVL